MKGAGVWNNSSVPGLGDPMNKNISLGLGGMEMYGRCHSHMKWFHGIKSINWEK